MNRLGLTILASAIAPSLLRQPPDFPQGCRLFDLHGQTEFAVYGANGGLSSSTVSYLVSRNGKMVWGFDPRQKSFEGAAMDFAKALSIGRGTTQHWEMAEGGLKLRS